MAIDISKDAKNVQGQLIAESLNPLQQNILKAIQKKQSAQVEEAMDLGVPVQQILKQSGINVQDPTQTQQIQQPINQALTQQPQTQVPPMRQILGGLIRQTPRSRAVELENVIREQQIRGDIPLQASDREKILMEQKGALDRETLKANLDSIREIDKAGQLTANNLFTKFEPIANEFQGIVDSMSRVEASVTDPSAAGDLALIFNYMKILDPGSVVREGEFATAQNSPGVSERVRAAYNRVINGERFTSAVREDFRSRAEKLFKSKERNFKFAEKQYTNLAIKNGIDPTKVLRKVELQKENGSLSKSEKSLEEMSDEELKAIAGGK